MRLYDSQRPRRELDSGCASFWWWRGGGRRPRRPFWIGSNGTRWGQRPLERHGSTQNATCLGRITYTMFIIPQLRVEPKLFSSLPLLMAEIMPSKFFSVGLVICFPKFLGPAQNSSSCFQVGRRSCREPSLYSSKMSATATVM
jgi:hypothetical protein